MGTLKPSVLIVVLAMLAEHNYVDDALPWTAAKMLQDDADRGDNKK